MSVYIDAVSYSSLRDNVVPPELSRGLRRADDYIRLAVAGTAQVLTKGDECKDVSRDRCGLVLGSCFSTMQTNFDVLDDVVSGEQTSPTLFSHSVFNSAAGYIASTMQITGAALTIIDFTFPFFKALQEGYLALLSGRLDSCIILQVETYSDLLADGRSKLVTEFQNWEPGVVCWYLTTERGSSKHAYTFDGIEMQTQLAEPAEVLARREQITYGSTTQTVFDPLGCATLLSRHIEKQEHFRTSVEIQSDCGRVELSFKRV